MGIDKAFAKGLIKVLKEYFRDNLWGVVLFGSRARGEGKSFSDWDIFILVENAPENPIDRKILLHEIFFNKGLRAISPILQTRKEFESNLRPLYLDISWDGMILFDRKGYVHSKMREIRNIIEKSRLQRLRKKGDWIWEWKKPPQPGIWMIDWAR
ncbi:MAG: nucleotidyltransferase domain-containing protein [Thermodesulfobacteriota bacterium]